MVALADQFIAGTGLYSVREAALYSRIHPSMMARWLFGNRSGERVFRPELGIGEERIVTFLDFVQALAIRVVRQQHRVPLDKIRSAIEKVEKDFSLKWPLARKHTIYLLGREIQIVPELGGNPIQLTGYGVGQISLRPIVEVHLRDLGWDAEGLANTYRAFFWSGREVRMSPRERFGEPLLPTCNYSARALCEAAKTEGGIETAAKAYGVDPLDVEVACRYCSSF